MSKLSGVSRCASEARRHGTRTCTVYAVRTNVYSLARFYSNMVMVKVLTKELKQILKQLK